MRITKNENFSQAYRLILWDLLNKPEYTCSPRGMQIREVTDAVISFTDPTSALYGNVRRPSQLKYIAGEFLWYFAGRNDIEFIQRFAKFWTNITNSDGTLNSAYGNLIFTRRNEQGLSQWDWAYQSLVKDPDTRQAIMHFNTPDHQRFDNKDFVCTLAANFHIRENKLNLTVSMRSNDAILGTPTDVAFFCMLQIQMHKLLKNTYPDLELGTYTHIAHSLHIYERHFDLVKEMLEKPFEPMNLPLLDGDFVNEKGEASEELLKIIEKIETNQDFSVKDQGALKWIYETIFSNE
jgi:thymidylate synthase